MFQLWCCRRTWKVRPSTWTVQVSAWSSRVRLWLVVWVHHGRERPLQLSHFSDSLAAISGSAVTLSLVEHEHARQAEMGIFELFKVSFSFLCPTLQMHVEGAPFNLDSSGVQHGLLLFDTGLLSGFTTVVSDQYTCLTLAAICGFAVTFGLVFCGPLFFIRRKS